jgi:hypothetical protein
MREPATGRPLSLTPEIGAEQIEFHIAARFGKTGVANRLDDGFGRDAVFDGVPVIAHQRLHIPLAGGQSAEQRNQPTQIEFEQRDA